MDAGIAAKLKRIGLTDSEAGVYLALLRTGSVTTGTLTKETKLHKSRVYECLNRLIAKGLVGFVVRDFAKYYSAANPERLLDYLEEKKKRIDDEKEAIQSLMPELLKRHFADEETDAFILKGREGLKTVHSDMLRCADEILYIGAKGRVITEIPHFFENYERERIKRGIAQKMLCSTEFKEHLLKGRSLTSYRYLPERWLTKNVIFIYADRVVNVVWSDEPIAVMIKNDEVSKCYKELFAMLWKHVAAKRKP